MNSVTYRRKYSKRTTYGDTFPDTVPSTPVRMRKRQKITDSQPLSTKSPQPSTSCRTGNSIPNGVVPSPSLVRRMSLDDHDPQDVRDGSGVVTEKPTSTPIVVQNIANRGNHSEHGPATEPVPSSSKLTACSSPRQVVKHASESSLSTPKKPARDLSQLFDLSPSPSNRSATPTATRVAKRMLHRSHTHSSVLNGRASSFPGSPSSREELYHSPSIVPQTSVTAPTTPIRNPTVDNASPRGATHHTCVITHAHTYAGKSRSFLVALPTANFGPLADLDNGDEESGGDFDFKESYTDLRSRWGVDDSEDDPRLDESQSSFTHGKLKRKNGAGQPMPPLSGALANDLKSISEMRNKGESRRFLDEVGYLIEGMDTAGGISLRRASALEIVMKFCDVDFARKAKATDFTSRAWELFRAYAAKGSDKVLEGVLAFFAVLVARDMVSFSELAGQPHFVPTLFEVLSSLKREEDSVAFVSAGVSDAMLKERGIGKSEIVSLKKLCDIISKSEIFPKESLISIPLLISRALTSLSPHLNADSAKTLYQSLMFELSLVLLRLNAYQKGSDILPSGLHTHLEIPSIGHITDCLYLLDSYILHQWSRMDEATEDNIFSEIDEDLARGLVSFCVYAEALMSVDPARAHKCTELTLRIFISLSHENRHWCEAILQQELTMPFVVRAIVRSHRERISSFGSNANPGSETDKEAQPLDRLCLALGLLTNLVQSTDAAKEQCRETQVAMDCLAKRPCIRSCRCRRRISALECLKTIYVQLILTNSKEDLSAELLRGHLAVLFGLLMRGNEANQAIILRARPGAPNQVQLESLLHEAREFVNFYTDLTSRVGAATAEDSQEDESGEPSTVPQWRDATVERLIRDGKSDHVARDVIAFLETLRELY